MTFQMAHKSDQEVPTEEAKKPPRTAQDRSGTRLARLRNVTEDGAPPWRQPPMTMARDCLARIRADGSAPASETVLIRSGFITRPLPPTRGRRAGAPPGEPVEEVSDLHPPKDYPSPLLQLRSANGIAHQIELLALFVAQHERGRRAGAVEPFTTPLLPVDDHPSWVALVVPTPQARARPSNPSPRSSIDFKRRQLTRALDNLAGVPLVELAGSGRGRYERFTLLEESGPRSLLDSRGYKVPGSREKRVISLPVEFFLNGWVYALTFNEIALYLMLRDLAPTSGEFEVPHEDRLRFYGVSRDAYSSWWMLEHAGLIRVVVDQDRLPNGRVLGYDPQQSSASHRFELTDAGLQGDGPQRVIAALQARIAGEPIGIARVNPDPGENLLTLT